MFIFDKAFNKLHEKDKVGPTVAIIILVGLLLLSLFLK